MSSQSAQGLGLARVSRSMLYEVDGLPPAVIAAAAVLALAAVSRGCWEIVPAQTPDHLVGHVAQGPDGVVLP